VSEPPVSALEPTPTPDLLLLAQNPTTPTEVLEQILDHPELTPEALLALFRHPGTPRAAMVRLAERATGALLDVLFGNLQRLGRWVEALEALQKNPAVPELKQLTIQQQLEIARKREADGGTKKSLLLQLKELPVGAKLALAKKGNKDVRMILIKDSNEMVALETVGSSRITDGEILAIATMRDVSDKILRYIANNRKYRQNRQIITALLNNPRTPVGVSLSLGINNLTDRELTDLSKNRNVPGVLSRAAKTLLDRRKGPAAGGGGH
jgi:DNA repair protein RadC